MWESLSFFGIKLYIPSHDYPVSLKINDISITQKAWSLRVFSKSELGQINAVRLAYQLTFLLELVDSDTLLIQSRFLDPSKLSKGDNKSWPVSIPSKKDFVVWRKFLASIVVRGSTLSQMLTK